MNITDLKRLRAEAGEWWTKLPKLCLYFNVANICKMSRGESFLLLTWDIIWCYKNTNEKDHTKKPPY